MRIAATQMLKKDHVLKQIPLIYVFANSDVQKLSIQSDTDSYLEKPFDFDKLNECAVQLTYKH